MNQWPKCIPVLWNIFGTKRLIFEAPMSVDETRLMIYTCGVILKLASCPRTDCVLNIEYG